MTEKKKILVVDDEATLCEALAFNLDAEGYEADTAYSAEEALALDLSAYDLVILDIMMGEISGTQLAGIMKSNTKTAGVPVIFCTAKDSEDDMVKGLDLGADDYVVKPYSLKTLLARIRTVLRRNPHESKHDSDTVSYKGLVLSPSNKTCMADGIELKLPRKEFEILHLLVANPDRIFTRSEILSAVWPEEVIVADRVIDVNITRIRQKIGQYSKNIVTRSGYGYMFVK